MWEECICIIIFISRYPWEDWALLKSLQREKCEMFGLLISILFCITVEMLLFPLFKFVQNGLGSCFSSFKSRFWHFEGHASFSLKLVGKFKTANYICNNFWTAKLSAMILKWLENCLWFDFTFSHDNIAKDDLRKKIVWTLQVESYP